MRSRKSQTRDGAYRPPEIVLAPNNPEVDDRRLKDFQEELRQGYTEGWSCKKTAREGDIYLFYFGGSYARLCGVGICDGAVEENCGEVDWTDAKKQWYCPFDLFPLKKTLPSNVLRRGPVLKTWWNGLPYRGRPKKLSPDVADGLIGLILERNPELDSVLVNRVATESPSSAWIEDDENPPKRITFTTSRVIRNTAKGDRLKKQYRGRCQACGGSIRTPDGGHYAEVHHLRPLGRQHQGMDNENNMIVLCPTCHAKFDLRVLAIEPSTMQLVSFERAARLGKVRFQLGHKPAAENLRYQWRRFQNGA